ncbi:MAG: SDR family NAD(P)-dependent oxidoreductase [Leptospiraceae bacterium]|nr:SDR family NAD(P)-dependent oxidoreductase [Leptospiraceae bacterium]
MKEKHWQNKHIVITGTSSGIGEAVLKTLSNIECTIFAIDRSPKDHEQKKAKIVPLLCDITNDEDVIKVSEEILKVTDTVDVFFNNAGITAHGRFDETEISVFRKTFDINFFGGIHLTKLLIEPIKKAKGAIMATSTVSGLYGIPGRAAYSSSKAALHAVYEAIRIELSEFGVRSIIFCPPYTRTALRTSGLDAKGTKLNEEQAKGKIKTPEEVASDMIKAVENPNSRLVTIDKSGNFVKWMRLFAPSILEKVLFKKLYNDFHH